MENTDTNTPTEEEFKIFFKVHSYIDNLFQDKAMVTNCLGYKNFWYDGFILESYEIPTLAIEFTALHNDEESIEIPLSYFSLPKDEFKEATMLLRLEKEEQYRKAMIAAAEKAEEEDRERAIKEIARLKLRYDIWG